MSLDAIVDDVVYSLSDGDPFWLLSMTGNGLFPIRRYKERGPRQHGSTDVGFTLDERMINIAVLLQAPNVSLAATYRDNLANILKPLESIPIKLRNTRDNGSVRQIDVFTIGTVDFPNTKEDRSTGTQRVVIQFEASAPAAYDPELKTVEFSLLSSGDLQIPLTIPLIYSSGTSINALQVLNYEGGWETHPVIYITGPATDVTITNETTDRVLDFTGTSIPPGLTYIIDLRGTDPTIEDSNGVNRIDTLTTPSHLARWSIVHAPLATDGANNIRVEIGGDATGETQVRFEYYDQYPIFD